jgi:excinuclease ABC subunit B
VGVNLLREGLDLPEVSLVAILDADKEGFLRSETSLIQTIGRSARNVNATVILYADKVTEAMRAAIDETRRRRSLQEQYNREHGITPQTIAKSIRAGIEAERRAHQEAMEAAGATGETACITEEYIGELQTEMLAAAEELDFEKAATLRDRINRMKDAVGEPIASYETSASRKSAGGRRRGRGRETGSGRRARGKIPRPKKLD